MLFRECLRNKGGLLHLATSSSLRSSGDLKIENFVNSNNVIPGATMADYISVRVQICCLYRPIFASMLLTYAHLVH